MVIVAAGTLMAYATVIYTFGVFLRPLTTEFGWERGALSGAYSLKLFLAGLFSIPSGRLSDRYGPRYLVTIGGLLVGVGFLLMSQVSSLWQVYLIWGVIFGVAGSACYVPIVSTIPKWFTKRRGMAVGITVTGFGLGGMISAPLAQWLISSYGWQQTFIILGAITFIIIISLAQFMKHSPQRMGLMPYEGNVTIEDKQFVAPTGEGFSFNQAIKTCRFWLFAVILFCYLFILQVIVVHIAPYAVDIGISAIVAASILSAIAGGSLIGRSLIGFVSDKIRTRLVLTVCLVVLTLALIWLLFAKETWMLYVFAVVLGVAYGGLVSLELLVPVDLFALGSLGIIFGSFMFCATIGGAVGPLLAGSIFDITGSYSLVLLICIIIGALAIILSLILFRALGRKREENLAFGSQYLQNTYGGGYFVNKGLDTLYRLLLL